MRMPEVDILAELIGIDVKTREQLAAIDVAIEGLRERSPNELRQMERRVALHADQSSRDDVATSASQQAFESLRSEKEQLDRDLAAAQRALTTKHAEAKASDRALRAQVGSYRV